MRYTGSETESLPEPEHGGTASFGIVGGVLREVVEQWGLRLADVRHLHFRLSIKHEAAQFNNPYLEEQYVLNVYEGDQGTFLISLGLYSGKKQTASHFWVGIDGELYYVHFDLTRLELMIRHKYFAALMHSLFPAAGRAHINDRPLFRTNIQSRTDIQSVKNSLLAFINSHNGVGVRRGLRAAFILIEYLRELGFLYA